MSTTESSSDQTALCALPLEMHWDADCPLPVRPVRVPAKSRRRSLGLEAPPWFKTGIPGESFDFTPVVATFHPSGWWSVNSKFARSE